MKNKKIDHSVIEDLSQGNHEAFEKVYKTFFSKTYSFAQMLLKNEDDADDVCQLIFMKLWIRRDRLINVNDFDAYLFMLSKNTILDYLSASKLTSVSLDNAKDCHDGQTPHEQVVVEDTQLLIDMVVDNMPPQRQTIYRMSREQHKKNEEIATELRISKKTVENHLNLALKDIKKALHLFILAFLLWV